MSSFEQSDIEAIIDDIIRGLLACYSGQIESNNRQNLFDINKYWETFSKTMLSELYSYGNFEAYPNPYQPYIDLHNDDETILVQVTTDQSNGKFRHTINNAPIKYKSMSKLIFFILANTFQNRNARWKFNKTYFKFSNNKENVIDFESLIATISKKYLNLPKSEILELAENIASLLANVVPWGKKFTKWYMDIITERKRALQIWIESDIQPVMPSL